MTTDEKERSPYVEVTASNQKRPRSTDGEEVEA